MVSMLITGSNRGIGLELVKKLVSLEDPPCHLIATCRQPETATELTDLAKRFKNIRVLQLDVAKVDSYPALVNQVKEIVGENGLNVLINNAGILNRQDSIEALKFEDYSAMLHTNAVAPVFLSQALLPLLKKAASVNAEKPKGIKRAAIINISSILGSVSLNKGGYWGYSESKAALNQASRSLAENVNKDGIIVVIFHPGWVQTDMGGPNATVTINDSAAGLTKLIYNLSEKDNNTFLSFEGKELPW